MMAGVYGHVLRVTCCLNRCHGVTVRARVECEIAGRRRGNLADDGRHAFRNVTLRTEGKSVERGPVGQEVFAVAGKITTARLNSTCHLCREGHGQRLKP